MHSLTDLCFLCLVRTENIKSVLSQGDDDIIIEEKLECVLSELIYFRPEIPKSICIDCLKGLDYVYKFKQKCLENLVSLNEYLDKLAESAAYEASVAKAQQIKEETQQEQNTAEQNNTKDDSSDGKNKKFVCKICHKTFAQVSHLKDHSLIHTGEKPYKCRICDYKCTRSTSLKRHMQIHTGDKHACKFCQQAFSTVSYLNKHIKMRHKNGEKTKAAPLQSLESQTPEQIVIKVELNDVHDNESVQDEMPEQMEVECNPMESGHIYNEEPHECPTCHETYNSTEHICPQHPGEKPYACEVCEKTFSDEIVLQTHKKVHSEEHPHECEICHTIFRKISDLIIHKQRIHSDVRPYECSLCNRTFATSGDLSSHMRSHTGEKPFACMKCDQVFVSMSALIYHKRIHNNVKPFECTECGRTFTQKCHLTSHMRIHTGEKPFKCELCDYRSRMGHHLKEHMKTQHPYHGLENLQ